MILLFLILATQPVQKYSVPLENILRERYISPKVYPFGIFANGLSTLHQFDFQGNLVLKIQGGPDSFRVIRAFHATEDFIWIVDEISMSSFFFDRKGAFLFQDQEIFSNNIQHLQDDNYIISPAFISPKFFPENKRQLSPFLRRANFIARPYPKLLKTMRLEITPQGVGKVEELRSFYKATESLSKTQINHKKLWAFKKANTFTVINQVDNFKSVYSPVHLNQERQIPPERPYKPRITPLNLPHFKEIKGEFQAKPFYEDINDHNRDVFCWNNSRSFIDNIASLPFGYLIGYTVPKVLCERGHLMVAQMNRDFRAQKVLIELDQYGILMGVHQNKVYVLVPHYEIENFIPVGADPEIWVYDLDK